MTKSQNKTLNLEVDRLTREEKVYSRTYHCSTDEIIRKQAKDILKSTLERLKAVETGQQQVCNSDQLRRVKRAIEQCELVVNGKVKSNVGAPSHAPKGPKVLNKSAALPSNRHSVVHRNQVWQRQQPSMAKASNRITLPLDKMKCQPRVPNPNPTYIKHDTTNDNGDNTAFFVHPDRVRLSTWTMNRPKASKHDLMIDTLAKVQRSAAPDDGMIDSGVELSPEDEQIFISGARLFEIDTTGDPSLLHNVQAAHYQRNNGAEIEMTYDEMFPGSSRNDQPGVYDQADVEEHVQQDDAVRLDLLQAEIDKQLYAAGMDVRDNDIWYDAEEDFNFDMLP